MAPFPGIGAFTYFTQRLVLTKRSMELSKTHLEWLGLLSFTLLPWLTAMLTQHLCMALATPSGRGGRKPLGCLLRCFLTTRSGNSTQLQGLLWEQRVKISPRHLCFLWADQDSRIFKSPSVYDVSAGKLSSGSGGIFWQCTHSDEWDEMWFALGSPVCSTKQNCKCLKRATAPAGT